MGYQYDEMKGDLFTDEGQRYFLKIRDEVSRLLKTSGAFLMGNVINGDDWLTMSCVDRMVELGEIAEIPQLEPMFGQDRVFVSKTKLD